LQTCQEQEARWKLAQQQAQQALMAQYAKAGWPPPAGWPQGAPWPPMVGGPGAVPPAAQPGVVSPQQWAYMQALGVPLPCAQTGPGGILAFPTHPYARSPRDFFMMETK
jgi:hypothetical protein